MHRTTTTLALLLSAACQPLDDAGPPVTPDAPDTGAAAVPEPPVAGEDEGPIGDPGRIPFRRLNRTEYRNTVRDLLGVDLGVADDFPVDDQSHGFDVVAEALAVSPLLFELYERAATEIAAEILRVPVTEPLDLTVEAEDAFVADAAYTGVQGGALALYSAGTVTGAITVPMDGTYQVSVRVWADQGGPDFPAVSLSAGIGGLFAFEIEGDGPDEAVWLSADITLPRGRHTLTFEWSNDFYATGEDRNVFVDRFRVEGPVPFVAEANPAHARWMQCDPDVGGRACIESILRAFTPVAWRRPVFDAEYGPLLRIVDQVLAAGDPPTWALDFALRAVLLSPNFLFLSSPAPSDQGAFAVDDVTLASRLSYTLWSSMPDAELSALAAEGQLSDPTVLAAQVSRMLDDPRAAALADGFAGQWLMIRGVDGPIPDFFTYPIFSEGLRASMKASMTRSFEDLVFEDQPLTTLLDGEWAWMDRNLAGIYGYPVQQFDDELIKIDVGADGRRGWLTQPGLLLATSYPTRTSPVRRGVWVLSNLLCSEPPPPPPDVAPFPDQGETPTTVRARLEQHRADPVCAGCHDVIDPIGLAFENYDGVGRFRDRDAGQPIDASGSLPDGTVIDGVVDLAEALLADERFAACVVDKLFTWSHGRAPTRADMPHLDRIEQRALADGFTLEAVFQAIAASETFRMNGVAR